MSAQKNQTKKQPPSEMIRVPVALKDAFRSLSRLHRQGRTVEVLQGIQELVIKLDSSPDIDSNFDIKQLAQRVGELESRLESGSSNELEEKLAAMSDRLLQLESAYK